MAATGRGFWRTSRTFSCLLKGNASFRPTITGTRTCFVAPGSLEDGETFEEMFRNSNFVKMGRPQGKLVAGRVTHVVENEDSTDLYVDFGWKFHAIVTQGKEGKRYKHICESSVVTRTSVYFDSFCYFAQVPWWNPLIFLDQ